MADTQEDARPVSPTVAAYQKRSWWQRLKARMAGSMHPVGTIAAPMGQHYEQTEAEQFYAEHGYSRATTPAPWSADIAAHNAAVDKEYREEIERRQAAMRAGEYTPRFILVPSAEAPPLVWAHYTAVIDGATPALVDDIDWDMELSLMPGRRTTVTHDPGVPVQTMDPHTLTVGREIGQMARLVQVEETKANTPRALIGSRATILASVGGIEALADQVEANARAFFGVEDLDAPLPVKVDAVTP